MGRVGPTVTDGRQVGPSRSEMATCHSAESVWPRPHRLAAAAGAVGEPSHTEDEETRRRHPALRRVLAAGRYERPRTRLLRATPRPRNRGEPGAVRLSGPSMVPRDESHRATRGRTTWPTRRDERVLPVAGREVAGIDGRLSLAASCLRTWRRGPRRSSWLSPSWPCSLSPPVSPLGQARPSPRPRCHAPLPGSLHRPAFPTWPRRVRPLPYLLRHRQVPRRPPRLRPLRYEPPARV
jgi:hypothetical protein